MRDEIKRIAILGGNSFSGSWAIRNLASLGNEIYVLNRSEEVANCYRAYENSGEIKVFTVGSNFSPQNLVDICADSKVEYVINFAAQSMVAESWKTPWDWYDTNVVWLSRLTQSISKWGRLKRWIQFTTPEVYGSNENWVSEDHKFNPTTPYAISRAAGDWHLMAENRRSSFPVIFTRTANVYGPFQQRYRLIPKALMAAAQKKPFKLHGGGVSKRSFIFVSDVMDALLRVIERGRLGESYHISTQTLHEIKDIVKMAYEAYDLDPSSYLRIDEERIGKDQAYMLGSNKIRGELGWTDNTSLATGIAYTKEWVDQWKEKLIEMPQDYLHKS